MTVDVRDRDHYVYRLLGKKGRVLYIGCTVNPERRLREWGYTRNIGPLMGTPEVLGPFPFTEARRLERELIEAQDPPFNIEFTPRERRGYSCFTSKKRPA